MDSIKGLKKAYPNVARTYGDGILDVGTNMAKSQFGRTDDDAIYSCLSNLEDSLEEQRLGSSYWENDMLHPDEID